VPGSVLSQALLRPAEGGGAGFLAMATSDRPTLWFLISSVGTIYVLGSQRPRF
jgi:hypothetical protein